MKRNADHKLRTGVENLYISTCTKEVNPFAFKLQWQVCAPRELKWLKCVPLVPFTYYRLFKHDISFVCMHMLVDSFISKDAFPFETHGIVS